MRRASRILVLFVFGIAASAMLWPADALAQRRGRPGGSARPAPAVRGGHYRSVSRSYYGHHRPYYRSYYGAYYRPYYYYYYYSPYYWGPYGWYPYAFGPFAPYGYGFYGGYYGVAYDGSSDIRIQVTPREAQVYVDGYFVGIVDDFDGFSQRLRLVPGEHEVELYLEGYRSIRETLLVRPRASYKIRHVMEKLGPGEPNPPKPVPQPSANPQRPEPYDPGDPGDPGDAGAVAPRPPGPPEPRGYAQSSFGTIAVRVQPADSVVLIDGERWDSPEVERLTVQVAAGTHRVEVRRDGHKTYTTEVQVRPGEVTPVNVSLPVQ